VKRFLRSIVSLVRDLAAPKARPGFVNLAAFQPEIDRYRRAGARIGRKVRFLGRLDGVNTHLISIGDCVVVGAESALLTHCPIKGAAGCAIGNYVYLAYNVIVLPGVCIGDYCIIGAGSVVTRDIPTGSIAAGNPARVLRTISEAEKASLVDTFEHDRLFGWSPRPEAAVTR